VQPRLLEEGQAVTFDDIAGTSAGDNLISYLKGDVDNLGPKCGAKQSVTLYGGINVFWAKA